MKVRDIHASCTKKEGFDNREDCQRRATHKNKGGGRHMSVYKCSNCGKFHFGCESKGNKMLNKHEPKISNFIDRQVIDEHLKDGECRIRKQWQ